MSMPTGAGSGQPDSPIRVAAWNALAVASLQYVEATSALRHILQCARSHGLTVVECCDATGLDEFFVERLLAEVA